MVSEYDIRKALASARTPDKHVFVASLCSGKELDPKESKAFLIYLVTQSFSDPTSINIILASWGLLRGFDTISSKVKRREELIQLLDMKCVPSNLNHREDTLYKELAKKCIRFHEYPDSVEGFLKKAIHAAEVRNFKLPVLQLLNTPSLQEHGNAGLPVNNNSIASHTYKTEDYDPSTFSLRDANDYIGMDELYSVKYQNYIIPDYIDIQDCYGVHIISGEEGVGKTSFARFFSRTCSFRTSIVLWVNAISPHTLHDHCQVFLSQYKYASGKIETVEKVKEAFSSFFDSFNNWLIVFENANYEEYEPDTQGKWENLWSYFPTRMRGGILITTTSTQETIMGIKTKHLLPFTREQAVSYLRHFCDIHGEEDELIDTVGCLPRDLADAAMVLRYMRTDDFTVRFPNAQKDFMSAYKAAKQIVHGMKYRTV